MNYKKKIEKLDEEIESLEKICEENMQLIEKLKDKRDSIANPELEFFKRERDYLKTKIEQGLIINIERNYSRKISFYICDKNDYYFGAYITTKILSGVSVCDISISRKCNSHIETAKILYEYSLEICNRYKKFLEKYEEA